MVNVAPARAVRCIRCIRLLGESKVASLGFSESLHPRWDSDCWPAAVRRPTVFWDTCLDTLR